MLVINGTVGSGKSTILTECSAILRDAGVPHVAIDFDALCQYHPREPLDPYGAAFGNENLAAIRTNALQRGIGRFMIAAVLANEADDLAIMEALDVPRITVVRLWAPVAVMQERLRKRELGDGREWHIARAPELQGILDATRAGDAIIENGDRPVRETAEDVLRIADWMPGA